MASVIPAIRAKLGTTEYFVTTMKAKDLSDTLIIPKDWDQWVDLQVEDRFQREIDLNRVKKFIAPYFANDPDRFCGSLIVTVLNHEKMEFEQILDVAKNIPNIYRSFSDNIGFLTLTGGEILIPLDGQHRLEAIKFAISGKDEKGKELLNLNANTELGAEDVTVILVRYSDDKARKIFNKVNRYARATSKGQNLITDDDDAVAVIARNIANDVIGGARIVSIDSNTLSKKAKEFTTLSVIYEATDFILKEELGGEKIDKLSRPDDAKLRLWTTIAVDIWKIIVEGIDHFQNALHDPSESGDHVRIEMRDTYLLGKPAGQLAMIEAFVTMVKRNKDDGSKYSYNEVCSAFNSIDWSISNPVWERVLTNGGRMITGRTAVLFAKDFITYLAGAEFNNAEKSTLLARYKALFPEDERNNIELPSVNIHN